MKRKKHTTESIIQDFKKIHGDKYDYSKTKYINSKTKIIIICPIHGEFEKRVDHHLNGGGCPKCSHSYPYTQESFIRECKRIHGNKYDYSKTIFRGIRKKIKVICPIHGEFEQIASSHLKGITYIQHSKNKSPTTKDFIQKAKIIHGDKYDYSKIEYINANTPVNIICPIHGEFSQLPNTHIYVKCGCSKCGYKNASKKQSLSTEEFIAKAKQKHGNKYDYSKVNYINSKTPIKIIDPIYGEFEQLPYYHLKNNGYDHPMDNHNKLSTEDFIKKANKIHNNYYIYSNVKYINSKHKIKIICPKHGEFEQVPNAHLNGSGCYNCNIKNTKIEQQIESFLSKNTLNYNKNDRIILNGLELDFYLPDYKIAIECNGIYWHSELNGKDKNYHLNKTNLCKEKGIQLIHIFEDEIINSKEIIQSKLNSILNINKRKLYARKCVIKEIDNTLKNKFLDKYHLQGSDKSSVKLGLCYSNKLISVMTFCKRRIALGKKSSQDGEYELSRYCGNFHFYVVGGASKLLKYFERNYTPTKIITYADKRWSMGDLYYKLGFTHTHDSPPNYWYFKFKNNRNHRFNFRKSELSKKLDIFDPNLTEWQNMQNNGWDRIWDCGNMVFEKHNKKPE